MILVCCVFIFIQLKILPNFPLTSYLTHDFFRTVLYSIETFGGYFPHIFILLIYDSIVATDILCII